MEGRGEAGNGGEAAGDHHDEEKPPGVNQALQFSIKIFYERANSPVVQFHGFLSVDQDGEGDN